MKTDFNHFLSHPEASTEKERGLILMMIKKKLYPSLSKVLCKLFALQVLLGSCSLLFCDQFGMGGSGHDGLVMQGLMRYGDGICQFGCGAFFFVATALSMRVVLNRDEQRMLERKSLRGFLILVMLFVGVFICFGKTEVFSALTLSWILGGLISLLGTLKLTKLIRQV